MKKNDIGTESLIRSFYTNESLDINTCLYSSNKNKGNKEIKIVASELNVHSNLYNSIYGTVKELMQFLESTINSENNSLYSSDDMDLNNELSTVDEILKIQGLLDSGVITQDEFDKIQSRLLGF